MVMENLAQSGLGNPVAGVLFVYRALDTLLEKVVLILALLGVWSLAPDGVWGGIPGLRVYAQPSSTLTFLAQLLPPVGIVVAIYMCWVGAKEPGGAFQGGTVLAAMWLLVMIAGLRSVPSIEPALAAPAARRRTGDFPCHRNSRDGAGECLPCVSSGLRQTVDRRGGVRLDAFDRRGAGPARRRPSGTGATAMNAANLFGLCGAALVGLGLYGLVTNPEPLRKILAFNLLGSGVFLVFGVVARRAAASGLGGDPVPQAMVITAIVVAFAATAMAIALVLRLLQETGRSTLNAENPGGTDQRQLLMPDANLLPDATTTDGALLVLAIVLPAAGVLLSFVLGGRYAERIASVLLPSGFFLATIIFADVWQSGHRLIYIVGDWKPPLGIALRADGLSAAMMVAMAIVICAVAIFAHADFGTRAGVR